MKTRKVSNFKSTDMTDLFKNIKMDDLDLSDFDTSYATNALRIYYELKKLKENENE